MRLIPLSSGSQANSTLIQSTDRRTNLLVDIGLSGRELRAALAHVGLMPHDITAVLLTHEHGDHIKGLSTFLNQTPRPLYLTYGTREGMYEIWERRNDGLQAKAEKASLDLALSGAAHGLAPHLSADELRLLQALAGAMHTNVLPPETAFRKQLAHQDAKDRRHGRAPAPVVSPDAAVVRGGELWDALAFGTLPAHDRARLGASVAQALAPLLAEITAQAGPSGLPRNDRAYADMVGLVLGRDAGTARRGSTQRVALEGSQFADVRRLFAAWDLRAADDGWPAREAPPAYLATATIVPQRARFTVAGLEVETAYTYHDAGEPVAFAVREPSTGKRVAVVTDTGAPTPAIREIIPGLDAILFESNYDPRVLTDESGYNEKLIGRIPDAHLANDQSARVLVQSLGGEPLPVVILAHLSTKANRPGLARDTMVAALRKAGKSTVVGVALQKHVGPAVDIVARGQVTVTPLQALVDYSLVGGPACTDKRLNGYEEPEMVEPEPRLAPSSSDVSGVAAQAAGDAAAVVEAELAVAADAQADDRAEAAVSPAAGASETVSAPGVVRRVEEAAAADQASSAAADAASCVLPASPGSSVTRRLWSPRR